MQCSTRWLVVIVAMIASDVVADEWPQFRGINAAGVSDEADRLPVEFSLRKSRLWSTTLGEGIACPVVSRGRVVVTTMTKQQTFDVVCFAASSG